MVKFIIIRHGYSVGNREKRFSGQMNTHLDEIGFKQAKNVAKHILENFKVDAIYSSDLSRAYETIKPLADELGITVIKDKNLREADVGKWQGMLIEDVKNEFPEEFEFYIANPGISRFPNGESCEEVMKRGNKAFEGIARANEGKTVVVATHGGVIRAMRAAWEEIELEKIKDIPHVPNASVSVANYDDGKFSWLQIGYNEHLLEKTTEECVR